MRAPSSVLACLGLVALLTPIASPLAAKETTLGRYVPAGVHFFVSGTSDKATEQFQEPYFRAFQKLVDSGIGSDIFDLATMELREGEREFARAKIAAAFKLLSIPQWAEMVSEEAAFAFRISIPIPEYIFLARGRKGTADQRFDELRQVLEGVSAFAVDLGAEPGFLSVTESTLAGAKVARLGVEQFPVGLMVANKNDTIILSTSDILLDSTLRLMDAEDASGSIVESERFKQSQKGLPDGTARTYFDLGGYIGFIRGMMGMAQGAAGFQPGGPEQAILAIVNTFFDELSRLETISSSERVKGRDYVADVRVTLAQRDGPGFIEKLVAEQEPIREFHRIIPKDASSFLITSGIDPETIYDVAVAFLEERVPDGTMIAEQWEGMQQAMGFHLKNDLLSWIDGGWGCITLPGPGGHGCECVVLMRLKDAEKAKRFLRGAFDVVKGYVESRGHRMNLGYAVDGENFRELRIDALPWCRPVIGTPGELLVIASSENAARRVVDTFKGEAPNISDHARFKKLKVPDVPLTEIYYYDVEDSLTGLADLIGTVGFFASLLPEDRDTRPAIKVGVIATKLATFLRDVDLSLYSAGWTRYDETKHLLNMRMVTATKDS